MESGGLTPKLKPKVNEMNEHDSGTFKTRSKCNSTRSVKELISGFEKITSGVSHLDLVLEFTGSEETYQS
jgi:hypothetical protein